MEFHDDQLHEFETNGALPLPPTGNQGYVTHDGARLWYVAYGSGPPVILLHGGLGHSGNWGHQVSALVAAGHRVILIDTRGHGRSSRDDRPYTYQLLATDTRAIMDALNIPTASFIGWSDGACIALVLAHGTPARVDRLFFFGCNVDPTGTQEFAFTPIIRRCFNRHMKDYAVLSPTPDQFDAFSAAVGQMQKTQPNYSAEDLAHIRTPVTIAHAEHDEFIRPEHAEYLARTLPHAHLTRLPGVSHFAPLQRPAQFNATLLAFLNSPAKNDISPAK